MQSWRQMLGRPQLPGGAIWPLRLFLGVTFIWASMDKLVDAQFFDPAADGYVGHQLAAGADASPLGGLLTSVIVPNATLFGMLVMAGELLIGLAVLLGWYTRFSALMGLLINLMFYLTITWTVLPYYYGADIVFVVGWLTLLIAGPGPLSVDAWLRGRAAAGAPVAAPAVLRPPGGVPGAVQANAAAAEDLDLTRRRFTVLAVGGVVALALGLLDMVAWPFLHRGSQGTATGGTGTDSGAAGATASVTDTPQAVAAAPATDTPAPPSDTPVAPPATDTVEAVAPTDSPVPAADTPPAPPVAATDTPAPADATDTAEPATATAVPPRATSTRPPTPRPTAVPTAPAIAAGPLIAAAGQVPVGQALRFTDPNSGGPAVLVHLSSGYKAYSAVCTHEGCTVSYSSGQRMLNCPCHGARFDPASGGQPIAGPARRPLAAIPITVGSDGGVYLAS